MSFLNPKPSLRERPRRMDVEIEKLGSTRSRVSVVLFFCFSCHPSRSSREIENHVEPGLGAVFDGARALEREPAVSLVKRYEILFAQ